MPPFRVKQFVMSSDWMMIPMLDIRSNPLFNSIFRIFVNENVPEVSGVPIVLTSSRAEMSHFHNDPFVAFTMTFPHKLIPNRYKKKWFQTTNNPDGSAQFAPYGLRKVEAMLIKEFGRENVITAHYTDLHKFIGKRTKLVGISTMDPMGLAYVSTTYNSLLGFGGEAVNSFEFKRLLEHPSILKYRPRIMVGGQGVWQIRDAGYQDRFGIDLLIQGESEKTIIPLVKKLMKGKPVEKYVVAERADYKKIPRIQNAACYGMVEITRGCGRGCQFCSPTMRRKHSFPIEHIMKEVELNIKKGSDMIFVTTEDIFLYRSFPGFRPNRPEIKKLFSSIAGYPGVKSIHLSHASLAPIIYEPGILDDISPILLEKADRRYIDNRPFITVEVGIETGSVRLMKKYMKGKAKPYSVDNWPELVVQGIGLMNDHDWYPLCTFMTGMPDETEADVQATLELLDDLKGSRMFYTPVLFIPLPQAMLSEARRVNLDHLSAAQWEFITTCWRNNIDVWLEPENRVKVEWLTFMSNLLLYRWMHGKKATKAILKLAGFPNKLFAVKSDKACEPELCTAHGNHHHGKNFEHRLEEIKVELEK